MERLSLKEIKLLNLDIVRHMQVYIDNFYQI
jgi:hypothetical protein